MTAELNADVKGAAASADYALERAVRRIVTIRAETGSRSRRGAADPGGRFDLWAARRALLARHLTPETRRAPVPEGRGLVDRAGSGAEQPAQRPATCLARPDLRLAAWFLWMTPLLAALSSCLAATWNAVAAAAASPDSAAERTRRTAVFRAERTATLR